MKYYIMETQMYGDDTKASEFVWAGEYYPSGNKKYTYQPIVIEADSNEKALKKYIHDSSIDEEDAWRYRAIVKSNVDEQDTILKESGCHSWEEYMNEMYPERPIEL